jgi:hypothetical protein
MANATTNLSDLSIRDIAVRILADWRTQGKGVNFAAVPYLDAMLTMEDISDSYGLDDGKGIVTYFLSNASSYRGETARELKAELKRRIK